MADAKTKKAATKKVAAKKEDTKPEVESTEPGTVEDTKEEKGDSVVEEQDKDLVEVSREDLAKFMTRLDGLEADNKRLLEASDKSRMAAIHEKEQEGQKHGVEVKLTRMGGPDGKLVVAWQMPKGSNQSYVDGNKLVEVQEMEVFFQDGTSERMPLIAFYRQQNKDTKAKVTARTKEEDGGETLKLRIVGTGEEVEISLKFVN